MKILYVSHLHPPEDAPLKNMGGMQRVSMQLVRELSSREDVELHTELLHASWERIGVKAALFLIKEIVRLPRLAREKQVDIILFSSMVTASLAYFIRNRVSVPMVTINHGQDVTLPVGIYQKFVPKIFEHLDGVISVSQATRQASIDRGLDPPKGVSLPNGFDLDTLQDFPGKNRSREEMNEEFQMQLNGRKMLLTVGRQVKRKGHEWFIRQVMPKIDGNVIYVIVGDGPEYDNIRTAIEQSECRDRIYLLGRQPDALLKKAYAAADLFIMPNIPVEGDMEGFGIVLLEANMARTPAVAADLEGIKDVIEQGENGYRVPTLDENGFSERINTLLINGLEELSKQTREFVIQRFSWEHVAELYLEYLQKVIEQYESPGS